MQKWLDVSHWPEDALNPTSTEHLRPTIVLPPVASRDIIPGWILCFCLLVLPTLAHVLSRSRYSRGAGASLRAIDAHKNRGRRIFCEEHEAGARTALIRNDHGAARCDSSLWHLHGCDRGSGKARTLREEYKPRKGCA